MSATAPAICLCFSPPTPELRMCEPCHVYLLGDRKLPSVNQIVRSVWPTKKVFDGAKPEVLEYARVRGVQVDAFFSQWLNTGNPMLEYGEWMEMENPTNGRSMREEVIVRSEALVDWWTDESEHWKSAFGEFKCKAQAMLHDDDVAGTADIVIDFAKTRFLLDMKSVWTLDPTYQLTTAAYMDMAGATEGGLIHITERNKQIGVKLIPIDDRAVEDWRLTKQFWAMAQRRKQ